VLPYWLVVLLAVLATHRVTRIVTRDQIPLVAAPREAFVQRWGVYEDAQDKHTSIGGLRTNLAMRSLAYLWECDWCASVWTGAAVAYCTYRWVDAWWWQTALLAAAASTVTGLIAQREPD